MTRFVSSQKSSSGTKKGYFSSCDFLNSLDEFRLTFVHYPIMLPNSPNKTSTEITSKRIIREYGDQCKLAIFMHLCRLNYVRHIKLDVELNTLEVCSQISEVKQVYFKGGRVQHDTPDELYDRYSILTVSLPADSKGWSIQLCSS